MTYSVNTHDAVLGREVDDLLLHVRGLILVRDLLSQRGAGQAELDAHARELERQRARLVSAVSGY